MTTFTHLRLGVEDEHASRGLWLKAGREKRER